MYSHAFDEQYETASIFKASALGLVKEKIKCLFWKASLRISNHIKANHIDLLRLLDAEPRLRFLMPIRNPMDCAKSNLLTGHAELFGSRSKPAAEEDVLDLVLDEILWFAKMAPAAPERVFHYFEYDLGPEVLVSMEKFLQLTPNAEWLSSALRACAVESKYEHPESFVAYFNTSVERKFAAHPEFARQLMQFSAAQ